jgi:hypothetical protein
MGLLGDDPTLSDVLNGLESERPPLAANARRETT